MENEDIFDIDVENDSLADYFDRVQAREWAREHAYLFTSPVYEGLPVLTGTVVDGFALGGLIDFSQSPESGDGFVVAPDGSRAGLIWQVTQDVYFRQVGPYEAFRWGVWATSFAVPMDSDDAARRNLSTVLPLLTEKWEDWKAWRARFT